MNSITRTLKNLLPEIELISIEGSIPFPVSNLSYNARDLEIVFIEGDYKHFFHSTGEQRISLYMKGWDK